MEKKITGAEALIKSLIAEGVDRVFGYPGGAIIPVYDKLYDYTDSLTHVLVRHEQGAIHAARDTQGCRDAQAWSSSLQGRQQPTS